MRRSVLWSARMQRRVFACGGAGRRRSVLARRRISRRWVTVRMCVIFPDRAYELYFRAPSKVVSSHMKHLKLGTLNPKYISLKTLKAIINSPSSKFFV